MPITLTVEKDDPDGLIAPAVADLEDNESAIEEAVNYQKNAEIDRLNAGDFPPPLKPGTIKRKQREGYPVTALVRTGALRDTLETRVDGDEGYVVATQFYGYIQQYGTGSGLPARKWLYVSPEDEDAIREAFNADVLARPGIARLKA